MKLEALASPGIIPNSQKLRLELVKAINFITVVSGVEGGPGSTSHASTLSAALAAAKTEVDKFIRVPVTGVTVTGGGSAAEGETVQLTAAIAPAGAQDKRIVWTSADPNSVSVDANGLCTVLVDAAGAVVITATSVDDPTKSGTATVTGT